MYHALLFSSRLKDFQYANELTFYLLNILEYIDSEHYFKYENEYINTKRGSRPENIVTEYLTAISGAIGTNNIDLADQLIKKFNGKRGLNTSKKSSHCDFIIVEDLLDRPIINGIYENGNPDLLDHFIINIRDVYIDDEIARGLITGGHLKNINKYEEILHIPDFYTAIQLNRKNVIQQYKSIFNEANSYNIAKLITYRTICFLPSIRDESEDIKNVILQIFIENGYLEELIKYQDILTHDIIISGISECLRYNHIDTFNFLNNLLSYRLKSSIYFDRESKYIYNYTRTTLQYLIDNGIIVLNDIKKFKRSIFTKMNSYNSDTAQYLVKFINPIFY